MNSTLAEVLMVVLGAAVVVLIVYVVKLSAAFAPRSPSRAIPGSPNQLQPQLDVSG
jgi:hypothetical protein